MKLLSYSRIFILSAFLAISAGIVAGQDNNKPLDGPPPDAQQPQPVQRDARGNMLRQLGLTREQMQQIRQMNMERRPLMEEAQRRLREANRALDKAIYADEVNDADIQARLKDVQIAQAEIQRLRYMNELSVRRILTPEQLVLFRRLREEYEQAIKNKVQENRPFRNMRPMDRPGAANDLRQPASNQPGPRPVARPNAPKLNQ